MADVFISYTRDERARCLEVARKLKALGLDVWFDANLASGTSFDREIEAQVRTAKAVLVLWSTKSVESNWVRSEATIGLQRDVLVSVQITPCTLPVAFTNTHTEFLYDEKIANQNPAWENILIRLAVLTGHPSLAEFRERAPRAYRPPKRGGGALFAMLLVGALAVGGGVWWTSRSPERPAEAAKTAPAQPAIDPEADKLARLVVGQWSIGGADCPRHAIGEVQDLTPSTGSWFTVQYEGGAVRTTTAGNTAIEEIVGTQNGWLRTRASGEDLFYRVDEAGRLLVRVGAGEPTRLEPCI